MIDEVESVLGRLESRAISTWLLTRVICSKNRRQRGTIRQNAGEEVTGPVANPATDGDGAARNGGRVVAVPAHAVDRLRTDLS